MTTQKLAKLLALLALAAIIAAWSLNLRGARDWQTGVIAAVILLYLALGSRDTVQSTEPKLPPKPVTPQLLAMLKSNSPLIATNVPNDALLSAVVSQVQTRNKINAIKALRESTHCGLKEGKDVVDEIDRVLKTLPQ